MNFDELLSQSCNRPRSRTVTPDFGARVARTYASRRVAGSSCVTDDTAMAALETASPAPRASGGRAFLCQSILDLHLRAGSFHHQEKDDIFDTPIEFIQPETPSTSPRRTLTSTCQEHGLSCLVCLWTALLCGDTRTHDDTETGRIY